MPIPSGIDHYDHALIASVLERLVAIDSPQWARFAGEEAHIAISLAVSHHVNLTIGNKAPEQQGLENGVYFAYMHLRGITDKGRELLAELKNEDQGRES